MMKKEYVPPVAKSLKYIFSDTIADAANDDGVIITPSGMMP